ncbi:hypothetical protein ACP275_06G076900 [Erythranthe tilingii]
MKRPTRIYVGPTLIIVGTDMDTTNDLVHEILISATWMVEEVKDSSSNQTKEFIGPKNFNTTYEKKVYYVYPCQGEIRGSCLRKRNKRNYEPLYIKIPHIRARNFC